MIDIDYIMTLLDWNESDENQCYGLELAKKVNCFNVFLQPCNKNINKNFYPYMAIIIFISSLLVIFNTSFITLLIYYILMNSFGTIIESESCSAVYESIKINNLEKYRKEHIMTFNIYMFIGQIISYSLVYVLYNYFYNLNILSITVSILMLFLIIATVYLKKTESYLYKNR